MLVSAGVDDTDWGPVAATMMRHQAEARGLDPLHTLGALLTGDRYDASDCTRDARAWDGWSDERVRGITANVGAIVGALRAADPGVHVTWVGYYNIAGTGSGRGRFASLLMDDMLPAACAGPIDQALERIHGAIRSGLAAHGVAWVDVDPVLGGDDALVQPFYARAGTSQGWPHPNEEGARSVSRLVLAAQG